MITTHDDGTQKSTNNFFNWNTGEDSIFLKAFIKSGKCRQAASQAVADGKATSGVHLAGQDERDRTNSIRNSK